jgi:hypothetical protein
LSESPDQMESERPRRCGDEKSPSDGVEGDEDSGGVVEFVSRRSSSVVVHVHLLGAPRDDYEAVIRGRSKRLPALHGEVVRLNHPTAEAVPAKGVPY